ncbi:UNVERIFIED_CONTAM: hypothetical protein FKN15_012330 [Acipenser sinensis]
MPEASDSSEDLTRAWDTISRGEVTGKSGGSPALPNMREFKQKTDKSNGVLTRKGNRHGYWVLFGVW